MEKIIIKKGTVLHKKYEDIKEDIKRKILEGEYVLRLPGLRKLADEYDVNIRTIRKAIEKLEKDGVVEILSNRGILISDRKISTIGIIGYFEENLFSEDKSAGYGETIFRYLVSAIEKKGDILIYKKADLNLPYINILRNHRNNIDGLIIFVPTNKRKKEMINLSKKKIPYITIGNTFFESDINYIDTDNFSDTKEAVSYLIKKGHKKILFIGDTQDTNVLKLRLEGYKKALEENNIFFDNSLVLMENRKNKIFEEKIEEIFSKKSIPSAIFGASCFNTAHLLELTSDLRKKIDIIVYDDFDDILEKFDISYGVIKQPLEKIAKISINSIYKMIEERKFLPIQIKLRSDLIFKERR